MERADEMPRSTKKEVKMAAKNWLVCMMCIYDV